MAEIDGAGDPGILVNLAYTEWCAANQCTHGHCPVGHEHPQPARYAGDVRLLCGYCWFYDHVAMPVVPCKPGICDG